MVNEGVIRDEPGVYRVSARYFPDGRFLVEGRSLLPLTLTVRVEDVWERIPESLRRYSYEVSIWRDDAPEPSDALADVAPDARIFLDFKKSFKMEFK
jgi:hypothetical protein